MTNSSEPVPLTLRPDEASAPFFEAAAEHRLALQQCEACGQSTWPAKERCPACWSPELRWSTARGFGVVFAVTIVHQVYHPALAEQVPYNVCLVELDEGLRVHARVEGVPNNAVRVGMRVQVAFEDLGPGVAIPRFRPAAP